MKNFLIYISLGVLLIGQYLSSQAYDYGGFLMACALMLLLIYFIFRISKRVVHQQLSPQALFFDVVLLMMTITIFAKYFNWPFWDYPTLIIVPVFMVSIFYYFIYKADKSKNYGIYSICGVYLIFTIPLFISPFDLAPRSYFTGGWFGRNHIDQAYKVKLPYSFKSEETERLSIAAYKLNQEGEYKKAISIYKKALRIEPKNPKLYFDLSECYAKSDNLERAISILDTAIILDTTSAIFHNNRGLYHYQLGASFQAIKDYRIAIDLDSSNGLFQANLAMAFYRESLFPSACDCIRKAEELKFNINASWRLKMIEKFCRRQNL